MEKKVKKSLLLYNIGLGIDILGGLLLLYGYIKDIFENLLVRTSIFIFSIIKLIGTCLQMPYSINNKFYLIKNYILIVLYIIILIFHTYEIYKYYSSKYIN